MPVEPEPADDQLEFEANGATASENRFIANLKGVWRSLALAEKRAFVEWIFEVSPELRDGLKRGGAA